MTYAELKADLQDKREKICSNSFSSQDKETFRLELIRIYDFLLSINAPDNYTPLTREEYLSYCELCQKWAERLILAFDYRLNPEMSFCIEQLVTKWNVHKEKKLVVFTLGDFQVLKIKRENNQDDIALLDTLSQRSGIRQTYEPIFIRVPDAYKDQMLTNIPLLHEVGHYVDNDNSITDYVYDSIESELKKNKSSRFLREHFPRFYNIELEENMEAERIIKNHISEYIADIFGAQYAHEYILFPAKFILSNCDKDDDDHPSLNCRKKFVEVFISKSKGDKIENPLLGAILTILNTINSVKLIECGLTCNELLADDIDYDNFEDILSSFYVAMEGVVKESRKLKIYGKTIDDYGKFTKLEKFIMLDTNIRKATKNYIRKSCLKN